MTADGNPRFPLALIYARQSDDNQRSTDEQADAGRARAEAESWRVYGDVYRDGISASRHTKKQRADWTRLLADLERPDVDVLWLWETSRGDRKLTSWSGMLDTCRERDVKIYVETHARLYDVRNARDWRTLAEDGIDNAYESDKTSLRILRDTATAAVNGMPHGKITYGYRREYTVNSSGRRNVAGQVLDGETAPIVREIFDRFVAGEGAQAIATRLNKRHVPTPRGSAVWRRATVVVILKNQAYVGDRVHRGQVTKVDAWPAIVDRDVFDIAGGRFVTPGPRRPDALAKSLLSGIAKCHCGGSMYMHRSTRTPSRYKCIDCLRVTRNAAWMEEHVTDRALGAIAEKQEIMATDEGADPDLLAAEVEAEALRARLKMWQDAGGDADGPSPAAVAKAEQKLLPQIAAAERRVQALRLPAALSGVDGPIFEVWPTLSLATQRVLIRSAVDIVVYPIGKGQSRSGVVVTAR